MATHYELLGVKPDATPEEIKKAYRKRARAVHPDTNPGAEDMFALINAAYEVLSDESSRAAYDRELKAQSSSGYSSAPPPPPPPPWAGQQAEWGTETSWDEDDAWDEENAWEVDDDPSSSATPPWEKEYTSQRGRGWEADDEEEKKKSLTKWLWEATKRGWQYILSSPYKHFFLVALIGTPVAIAATGMTGSRQWVWFFGGALVLAFLGKALGGRSWRRWLSMGIFLVQGLLIAAGVIVQLDNGEPSVWVLIIPIMVVIAIVRRAITKPLAGQPEQGREPEAVRTSEVDYYQH